MLKSIPAVVALAAAVLLMPLSAAARDFEATVRIISSNLANVRVEGRLTAQNVFDFPKNWAFARPPEGAAADRISAFELKDSSGRATAFRKLMPGEYLAEDAAVQWSYQADLGPTGQFGDAAHISWIKGDQGIVMLGDLLPLFSPAEDRPVSAKIRFEIPEGWSLITNEERTGENEFEVADVSRAVFAVGRGWRERRIPRYSLNIAATGDWRFSDDEAESIAIEIMEYYRKLLGGFPIGAVQIILVPAEARQGRWEAETRGRSLTIVSGDMLFKKLSVQRLHEQLRHELLHLWIPNDLALTGNYDWFYEGFTVYQALRAGLDLNRISFDDFLATLAEAYVLTSSQSRQFSMAESSRRNSGGRNPSVYARGLVIAFIADTAMLRTSKGRNSIEDFFREVYRRFRRPNQQRDGTAAILGILKNRAELVPVARKFIEGAEAIDWLPYLNAFGIDKIGEGDSLRLQVKQKPDARQSRLLDKLGYNNWRNMSEK